VIYLIVITLGIVAFLRLSIDLMPEITNPTVSVSTSYGNVGPQEMEELVTRPIEESLAAVQGVQEISSNSTEGRSVVRVLFTWGSDLDVASNDIRDRIDRVLGRLPVDAERPLIQKFDLSAYPVMQIGVSTSMNALDIRQLVEDQILYRIERVPGVASASIGGGLIREIHVDLKASQLKALGLSTEAIISAIQSENRNIPAGIFERGNLDVLIRTLGEYTSLDEIRNTVVTVRDGIPIQVKNVANVVDSWQEVRQFYRVNGKTGMRISVNKQSGANTVKVAEAVNAEIQRIDRDFPQLLLIPLIDTSVYIKQSINNTANSAIIGGMLAVLILFLFLRSISSTVIIATAIPISIIATFGLIYLAGYTLNIMTFGGLALGVGMLVDNSIVVLENIYRHREQGLDKTNSVLTGATEVRGAIMASTLTTVVVFIPVIFVRGVSGIMFQQMAVVVSFALLCSLVVSLTLTPMLSFRFLKHRQKGHFAGESRLHRVYAWSEITFANIEQGYSNLLGWSLMHKKLVIAMTLILFLLSVLLTRLIGVEFMPSADEGEVRISLRMAVGTRLEIVDTATQAIESIILKQVPELSSVITTVGGSGGRGAGSSGSYTASFQLRLVPKAQRSRSSDEIANDLRQKLTGLPGVTIRVNPGQGLFVLRMGTTTANNVSVEIRGYDMDTANELAHHVERLILEVSGITDTQISRDVGDPEQVIRIDRQKAADLGLTVARIGNMLQTAVGGTLASNFRQGGNEYHILVRLSEQDRKDLANLLDLTIVNNQGQPIVLRNVVSSIPREGPVQIERKNQERIITVSANFTGRDMGSIISDIRQKLQSVPIPKDFTILFGGDYEEQQKAFKELLFSFFLAVFLVYLVMAGQFESFRHPFIILFSIPMALIGVTLTMILSNTIFSMQAFIGCILLAGIVVNNAILLVDYTNQLRSYHNMGMLEAIKTAGARRLRPILMTALTTCLGLVPLSLGLGEGGEAQAPMARVVIGGLMSATLITLVFIPVVYSIFERKSVSKEMETS
jgi:HAE1 family hydrophobic/amphiphilic exporter-1